MSLKLSLIEAIPSETIRVARAAFPKGNLYTITFSGDPA
jgi:hypothetical protein